MADFISAPSLEEWKRLYASAIEFKRMAPWKWIADTEIFGVQNPLDGEIGYCCVLGNAEEFFGLAVYLGTKGLAGYLDLLSGKANSKIDVFEILVSKLCLVASFESKSMLTKEDLAVIKKLGLSFKGRYVWPQFRFYEPGYFPWYLNQEQVIFLTHCLNQAMEVALRVREDPDLIVPKSSDVYFVRALTGQGNDLVWSDTRQKPQELKEIVKVSYDLAARLKGIETSLSRTDMKWEIDTFFMPMPVKEKKGRPYYPLVFLCIDKTSDFIVGVHLAHRARYEMDFVDFFVDIIKEHKILPRRILAKKQELINFLEPLLERFSIEPEIVTKFTVLDKAQRAIFQEIAKGGIQS
ncbi:hypothetical protein JXB22_08385 [candidate division WOR-3 bacterium]|nr:hypothetical protein [candidate division WOR-3 bacterium]